MKRFMPVLTIDENQSADHCRIAFLTLVQMDGEKHKAYRDLDRLVVRPTLAA